MMLRGQISLRLSLFMGDKKIDSEPLLEFLLFNLTHVLQLALPKSSLWVLRTSSLNVTGLLCHELLFLGTPWGEVSSIPDFSSHVTSNTVEMSSSLLSWEVKEDQEFIRRWRPGRKVRGSLAVAKPWNNAIWHITGAELRA